MAMERNIAIFTLQLFRIAKGDRKCSAQRTNPACRYRSIKVRQRMSRNYVALAQDPEVGLAGSHKDEVINLWAMVGRSVNQEFAFKCALHSSCWSISHICTIWS